MKALFTIAISLGFAAFASAQEVQDKLQQQPEPVTQAQVERDARMAAEHRKQNEEARKAQQKALKKEAEKATAVNTAPVNNRKSSTRPEQ